MLKEKMLTAAAGFLALSLYSNIVIAHEECVDNLADIYPCVAVDLEALIPADEMHGSTTDKLSE